MSYEFLITAIVVCLAPGIGVVYTLSVALGSGFRAGVIAAFGCAIATVVHLLVAMGGLAAVLHTSAVLFQTLKFAGVAYLLWMAWGTLRAHDGMSITAAVPRSGAEIIRKGILLNILNPKLPMFFLAFLPQFIPADVPDATALLVLLGMTFVGLTFGIFVLYAAFAGIARRRVLESPRVLVWLRRAFAASFALLGLRLATERL